ncbi:MAG: hypothetical protein R3F17_17340 [Planctomycetota bacterium]
MSAFFLLALFGRIWAGAPDSSFGVRRDVPAHLVSASAAHLAGGHGPAPADRVPRELLREFP